MLVRWFFSEFFPKEHNKNTGCKLFYILIVLISHKVATQFSKQNLLLFTEAANRKQLSNIAATKSSPPSESEAIVSPRGNQAHRKSLLNWPYESCVQVMMMRCFWGDDQVMKWWWGGVEVAMRWWWRGGDDEVERWWWGRGKVVMMIRSRGGEVVVMMRSRGGEVVIR